MTPSFYFVIPLPFPSSYTSFRLLPVFSHVFFMSMTPLSVLLLVVSVMCPWLQASLPVSSGALRFRSAVQLAPSAFSASAAVSLPVFSAILVAFQSPSVPFQEVALDHWSATLLVRLQVSRELGISPRFLLPSPPCVIMLQIPSLGLAFRLSPLQNLDCGLMPSVSLRWAFAWMIPPFALLLVFAWDFHCAILTLAVAVVVMLMSLPLMV